MDTTEKACELCTAARRVRLCVVTVNQTYVFVTVKDLKFSPEAESTHTQTQTHTHTGARMHRQTR